MFSFLITGLSFTQGATKFSLINVVKILYFKIFVSKFDKGKKPFWAEGTLKPKPNRLYIPQNN